MKWIFWFSFSLISCQTTNEWVETPLYPGSLNAVLTGSYSVLKRYSDEVSFEKSTQTFETGWYNPDTQEVKGYIRRAKITIKVYGIASPFTIAGRVMYEQADLGSEKSTGGSFQYEGELTKHARNILRQIMTEAETIDGKYHTIDRVKVF